MIFYSTYDDPWKRPDLSQLKEKYPIFHHLHPVGRLDADSSGLLLFSRDGSITQHLLNPKKKVEREYDCLVLGAVHYDNLRDLLKKGVNTSEGIFPATLTEATVFSGKEVRETDEVPSFMVFYLFFSRIWSISNRWFIRETRH